MSIVFVPQQPSRFDTSLKRWIPSVNLSPAEKFGELLIMLPPDANRLHTSPLTTALKEKMESFGKNDWLVAIGDPSLIAIAACIALRKAGVLRLLKWDRMTSDYLPVETKI